MLLPSSRTAFDFVREAYQAFALYSFLNLMINYLGGERRLFLNLETRGKVPHLPPLKWCLRPFTPSPKVFGWIRLATLQFAFVMPITAITAVILKFENMFIEEDMRPESPYFVLWAMNNISMIVSMYALVQFYVMTEELLQPFRPLAKFLCIKFVVFFGFWQQIFLFLLLRLGLIPAVDGFSAPIVTTKIHESLLCVEMVLAAIFHTRAFPVDQMLGIRQSLGVNGEEEEPEVTGDIKAAPGFPLISRLGDVVTTRDLVSDARSVFSSNFAAERSREGEKQKDSEGGSGTRGGPRRGSSGGVDGGGSPESETTPLKGSGGQEEAREKYT
uniref:Transmembrane protein 184C n=1 Tax=Chromera velia CCMP2878 TaxID=1169474 RepID=A0A0G4GFV6_9ALVE|eukprot:Cvel_4644.t1-p1 / transcript=Cvel_4644.t1 / gene=Cvel_4644 / organism=Chromera_velia_CCMP2878 / gene_product=Transmembrane protein 184A, putative / transcript_product=Transmembrane protein 184A, putative / location=Cvel_scaffold205:18377-21487(+) / protein_length=328 / sequence_SO=supercontig / SO=protein_coding / is_pseudo=false